MYLCFAAPTQHLPGSWLRGRAAAQLAAPRLTGHGQGLQLQTTVTPREHQEEQTKAHGSCWNPPAGVPTGTKFPFFMGELSPVVALTLGPLQLLTGHCGRSLDLPVLNPEGHDEKNLKLCLRCFGHRKAQFFHFKHSAMRVCDAWHKTDTVTAGSSGQRCSNRTCNYTDIN